MVVDVATSSLTSLIPQGLPIVGGGLVGFVSGWLCRKLIKIAIIGIGLLLALLAYLEYQKWIKVDWAIVNHQTSDLLHTASSKMLQIANNTATDLNVHQLNHVDIAFPIFGALGFIPGFALGLIRG